MSGFFWKSDKGLYVRGYICQWLGTRTYVRDMERKKEDSVDTKSLGILCAMLPGFYMEYVGAYAS